MSVMDRQKFYLDALRVVPRKGLSRGFRRLTQVKSQMAVRRFAARFDLDMDEAERPLDAYESILDLFTRRLKPGARPIDPAPEALVSPADGAWLVGGPVGDGNLPQAKGRTYGLGALLAEPSAPKTFRNGACFTIYLSPRDYHRVHSPVDGAVTGYTYVPGDLFPVNAAGVQHVDQLFARNERLVIHLETETFGRVEVVMVGATNVGHMTLSFDPSVATNTGHRELERHRYDPPIPLRRGDELGVFEMGSTVIVVTERGLKLEGFQGGEVMRLGRRIGVVSEG